MVIANDHVKELYRFGREDEDMYTFTTIKGVDYEET